MNDRVEFRKSKGFKRQNSYLAQLEEFGDIDDTDALKRQLGKIRRSVDYNPTRLHCNIAIKDVA